MRADGQVPASGLPPEGHAHRIETEGADGRKDRVRVQVFDLILVLVHADEQPRRRVCAHRTRLHECDERDQRPPQPPSLIRDRKNHD